MLRFYFYVLYYWSGSGCIVVGVGVGGCLFWLDYWNCFYVYFAVGVGLYDCLMNDERLKFTEFC